MRPAIERAVQELVHPVVERSIKICLTTAEMIVKKVSDLVILSYKPEFFQAFFLQLQLSCVYNCDDVLSYNSSPRGSHI